MANAMDPKQGKKIPDESSVKAAVTEICDEELSELPGGGNSYKEDLEAAGNHLLITTIHKPCEKYESIPVLPHTSNKNCANCRFLHCRGIVMYCEVRYRDEQ